MSTPTYRSPRDRGTALPMVLVFIVIGTLVVLPLLSYASTVLRVNSISVQKTEAIELVRGGARVAVADPTDLFVRCSGGLTTVPTPAGATATSTTCREVSRVAVLDELEVPHGGVAIQVGESVPVEISHTRAPDPGPALTTDWWGDPTDTTSCTAGTWCPDPIQNTVWLPPLPESATAIQEATGYPLPAPRNCTIFFPGTYQDPVVIDGPTYFVSGVYTFNDTLTVVGGADAVLGFGLAEGCVGNDVAAVLDMHPNPLPPTLNAEGNGATLIFADEGRLIVDDTVTTNLAGDFVVNAGNLPIRFEINQRYIQNVSDTAARVSIMSINGDHDIVDPLATPPTTWTGDLDVPGIITMPESLVKTSTGALEKASAKGLIPSSLTAEPRAPNAPTLTAVQPLQYGTPVTGAARVEWAAPVGLDEGGSVITKYLVTATPTPAGPPVRTCQTDGLLQCVVRDLERNQAYQFTLVAGNVEGDSDPSAPMTATPKNSSPELVDPQPPANVLVADPDLYEDDAEVTWDPPFDTGNAPIVGYRVEAYRVYVDDVLTTEFVESSAVGQCETWSFRDQPAATTCVVTGLPELDTDTGDGPLPLTSWLGYRFAVTAITGVSNEGLPVTPFDPADQVGEATSALSDPPIAEFDGSSSWVDPNPGPPVWPVAPPYVPDPIVEVNLTAASGSTVTIAGYTAIPQGRLRVHNPTGQDVKIVGGVVAAAFDIDAATLATMDDPYDPTDVGFENVVLQRTVELVTRAAGERVTSTMRVQINANGADMTVNSWVIQ